MVTRIACIIGLSFLLALTACQEPPELPTLAPTVVPVAQEASATPVPLVATNTPPAPTATFTPLATPVVLTPRPTPLTGPGVNITSPSGDSEVMLGSEVVASGLVQLGEGQELLLALSSASGHVLAQIEPTLSELNSWQATLTLPASVSGQAEIQALLIDENGAIIASDIVPIMLTAAPGGSDRYLILNRPLQAEEAVAGYNLFFDGFAEQPTDNLITISLWTEACQSRVAVQSFRLRGSGYWQGFVIVPAGLSGQLCAVAHFGEPGSDSWREAQVQVNVLPPDDGQAMKVMVGNPPPGSRLAPGQSLLLYGTAYNAPEREILISILLENGRLLTEGVTVPDIYGYWELELFIPPDAAGPAQIEASIGEPGSDEFAQSIVSVQIGDG